jgi:hypothetical protein
MSDVRGEICKIVSRMLDNPGEGGIYPTTRCYDELEALINAVRSEKRRPVGSGKHVLPIGEDIPFSTPGVVEPRSSALPLDALVGVALDRLSTSPARSSSSRTLPVTTGAKFKACPMFTWLDPMARDYRGREDQCWKEIVEGDKEDIEQCEAVVAKVNPASAGTSMEILWAWLARPGHRHHRGPGKPVGPLPRHRHLRSEEAALQRLKELLA